MNNTTLATRACLRRQLIVDTLRLRDCIARYSRGDTSVKSDWDQIRGAVQIKVALLRGMRKFG